MRILIVDPTDGFASQIQQQFSPTSLCEFVEADIQSGLTKLARRNFDVLLLDPFLDENHKETCQRFLSVGRLPILVMSGQQPLDVATSLLTAGVQDVLPASRWSDQRLLRRIRFAIERCGWPAPLPKNSDAPTSKAPKLRPALVGAAVGGGGATTVADDEDDEVFLSKTFKAPQSRQRRVAFCGGSDVGITLITQCLESAGSLELDTSIKTANYGGDIDAAVIAIQSTNDLELIDEIQQQQNAPAIVVVANSDDDVLATEIIRRGAQDFVPLQEVGQLELEYLIHCSIARHSFRHMQSDATNQRRNPTGIRGPHMERRRHTRYNVSKSVFAIPILPDGGPAQSHSAEGFSVDVSEGGLLFEIRGLDRLPTRHLLVGIEAEQGELHFATVEVCRQEATENGLQVGASFTNDTRDVIRESNLVPTFDPVTSRFSTMLPEVTLKKWVEFGIFQPVLVDRVLVCPKCRGLPSFRRGCRMCGSVRVSSPHLIHHFACANVGYVEDYQSGNRLICPKCQSKDLMVGADFEYLNGPYTCLDCNWQDNELESVAKCLGCKTLFPAHQAVEEELIGYHVNRLDPLVLINSV